jgi:membrane protein DedA with SNARE-associated domain
MAEMRFSHFLIAVFSGRFFRFVVLSFLVIHYGPQIVGFMGGMVHSHWRFVIAAIATVCLVGWWLWRMRRLKSQRKASTLRPSA